MGAIGIVLGLALAVATYVVLRIPLADWLAVAAAVAVFVLFAGVAARDTTAR